MTNLYARAAAYAAGALAVAVVVVHLLGDPEPSSVVVIAPPSCECQKPCECCPACPGK